jgi:hypothetical protein
MLGLGDIMTERYEPSAMRGEIQCVFWLLVIMFGMLVFMN